MIQVVAALIVREGKVLICQRTRHQTMPLKWEFPGGKVEDGESPHAALLRELEEELGIAPSIGPEVARLNHTYGHGRVVELQFFAVRDWAGEVDNRIFRDVRWVAHTEISGYDFLDADLPLVREISLGHLL